MPQKIVTQRIVPGPSGKQLKCGVFLYTHTRTSRAEVDPLTWTNKLHCSCQPGWTAMYQQHLVQAQACAACLACLPRHLYNFQPSQCSPPTTFLRHGPASQPTTLRRSHSWRDWEPVCTSASSHVGPPCMCTGSVCEWQGMNDKVESFLERHRSTTSRDDHDEGESFLEGHRSTSSREGKHNWTRMSVSYYARIQQLCNSRDT